MAQELWSDKEIAEIKTLWSSGMSASMIGAKMGKSRNAIIGKVHRLGLPYRKTDPALRLPSFNSGDKKIIRRSRIKSCELKKESEVRVPIPIQRAIPVSVEKLPVEIPEWSGNMMLIPLEELRYGMCKWPTGDRNYKFCGCRAKRGKPYCEHHCTMAYLPLAGRSRRGR
jgi:GcrA cell cycle regulator